jgi:hypothetical protein
LAEADKEEFIIGMLLLSIDANRRTAIKIKKQEPGLC